MLQKIQQSNGMSIKIEPTAIRNQYATLKLKINYKKIIRKSININIRETSTKYPYNHSCHWSSIQRSIYSKISYWNLHYWYNFSFLAIIYDQWNQAKLEQSSTVTELNSKSYHRINQQQHYRRHNIYANNLDSINNTTTNTTITAAYNELKEPCIV
jgi:hypothetical protein